IDEPAPAVFEPVPAEFSFSEMNEPVVSAAAAPAMKFDDAVLDLEDEYVGESQINGDVLLDLDFGDTAPAAVREGHFGAAPIVYNAAPAPEPEMELSEIPAAAIAYEWPAAAPATAPELVEPLEEEQPQASTVPAGELSPAVIDAIARRMVEQMSDKVIREIAWEVVPQLSELLIKQKLSEPK